SKLHAGTDRVAALQRNAALDQQAPPGCGGDNRMHVTIAHDRAKPARYAQRKRSVRGANNLAAKSECRGRERLQSPCVYELKTALASQGQPGENCAAVVAALADGSSCDVKTGSQFARQMVHASLRLEIAIALDQLQHPSHARLKLAEM